MSLPPGWMNINARGIIIQTPKRHLARCQLLEQEYDAKTETVYLDYEATQVHGLLDKLNGRETIRPNLAWREMMKPMELTDPEEQYNSLMSSYPPPGGKELSKWVTILEERGQVGKSTIHPLQHYVHPDWYKGVDLDTVEFQFPTRLIKTITPHRRCSFSLEEAERVYLETGLPQSKSGLRLLRWSPTQLREAGLSPTSF